MVRLTPRKAAALVAALESAVMDVEEDAEEDVAGVGDFMVVLQAYPRPGTEAGAPS